MGAQLGLRDKNKFVCLWVIDFPMFEWSEEEGRLMAMHHPFTHPKEEDIPMLDTDPAAVRADAYDMVVNGVEVGGGSIRIHDAKLQAKMFEILGFTPEKAQAQFGFLMNAFKYGAPPHGGLAYGPRPLGIFVRRFDSIRDCIAFPKNNSGRDVMLDAPSAIDQTQLDELNLIVDLKEGEERICTHIPFIIIGTMNALIMALVVWLMMKEMSFDGDYMVANITAYLIAQIHNFICANIGYSP